MELKVDVNVMVPELADSIRALAEAISASQCIKKYGAEVETVEQPQGKSNGNTTAGSEDVKTAHPQEEPAKAPAKASDPTPTPAEQTVSLEQVRAKLAALSQAGKQDQVRELISEFGGRRLSDVPMDKYPLLLAKAEELA